MGTTGGTRRSDDQAGYQTFFTFFGLRENPFRANPDPRYLFFNIGIRRALNELTVGSQSGKSLIVLTGEAGTGKTSLINYLLSSLQRQEIPVSFVFNSHLDINNLFEFVLSNFGVRFDPRHNPNLRMLLNQWLTQHYQPGKVPVIILDEAQGLPTAVLEEVRMLLNLEVGGESVVRIVLAGQPDLDLKLQRPELRQLRQRITVRCRTGALSQQEARGYIQHRLQVAGSRDGAAFSPEAMDAVYFYSAGIPRVMNLICEHSLINAYSEGIRPVSPAIVEGVAWDFRFDEFRPLPARSSDRLVGDVIPMDSSPSRMRMSALQARDAAPIEEPAVDEALVAELMTPSSSPDILIPPVSPVVQQVAAVPVASVPKIKVVAEPSVPKPPEPSPAVVGPALSQAPPAPSVATPDPAPSPVRPPVRRPAIASPVPLSARNTPRPVAATFRSSMTLVTPIKARFRATSALLEASVTRMMHKLDELKAVEKLQRLADSSIHWLRQPMRPTHSHRTPFGTRQKS